jgi:DNA-binding CsgD family transcriptional regulator
VTPTARWPFVGRDHEIDFLLQVLDAHPGAVLSGVAGVGKSSVVAAVAASAGSAGWSVANVEAAFVPSTVPLAPFAGLLPASTGADALDRIRALVDAVAALGERRLLVVDDAHALDELSVVALRTVVSSTSARVLLAVRTGERVPDGVLALVGDAPRLELQPLAEIELVSLVEHVIGGVLDATSRRRLWATTEGNPFFARELVFDALERGTIDRSGAKVLLPAGPLAGARVRDAVAARLGALDDVARDAIDTLAIGQPVGIALMERLVPVETLHELERRSIITSDRRGLRTELRLAHPLYAEVARAEMGAVAERVIRRRLVDAIESTGARRDGDPLRLAIWRADLGDLTDARELLGAATALERVHHRAAFLGLAGGRPELLPGCLEAALRIARLALDATRRMPAVDLVARILARLGRLDEAAQLFVGLDDYVVDDEDAALAARLRAQVMQVMGAGDGARDLLLAAEADAVADEHVALLRVARLQLEALSGRYREVLATADAVRAGGELTTVDSIAIAGALGAALVRSGRATEGLTMLDSTLARATGDEDRLLGAVFARLLALGALGRLAEAGTQASSITSVQDHAGDAEQAAVGRAVGAALALERGRPATALDLAEGALAGLRASDVTGMRRAAQAVIASASALLGREDAAALALGALEVGAGVHATRAFETDVRRAQAWILACAGRVTDASAVLSDAATAAGDRGLDGEAAGALHDLVRIGSAGVAVDRLEQLAARVEGPFAVLARDHARAAIAGDGRALDAIVDRAAALGADLVAADAAAQAEAAHLAAGLKARATASRRRCRDLLLDCEGATTPAVRARASDVALTGRERDVAELAARGLADKEIAAALRISVRTVTTHLARSYGKLGADGRRDLARLLEGSPVLEQ